MIKADKITKRYKRKTVIDSLCFEIADGEKILLTGASGSGKTTLLRLITCLEKPDFGSLSGYNRRDISYMFQEPRLLMWENLYDNVMLPFKKDSADEAGKRTMRLLCELGLAEDTEKFPSELSGGMKQRTALVRALAYDKPILLLDEPFSALDRDTKLKAAAAIRRESDGKTVILVSHGENDAELVFGDYRKLELKKMSLL